MAHPKDQIVVCADRMRAVFWEGMWRRTMVILAVYFTFAGVGWLFHAPWWNVLGIMIPGISIVAPHILRIQRCLTHLPCPACGRKVGDYFSKSSRIHLRCRHCGVETPTDCGSFSGMGGPPYKI